MKKVVKMVEIKNCLECPHIYNKYEGQGIYSFYCGKTRRGNNAIAVFCENRSEEPQDHKFPKWCPLKDK